jgi:hypothetical protein
MELRLVLDRIITRMETAERALAYEKARHAECERKMLEFAARAATAETRLDGVLRFGPGILEVKP